jgi:beta-galactosidase/beta-glucuronidase
VLTPWGAALDPDHPLPEYPRPQLVRASYLNLNGRWQYAVTRTLDPPDSWAGTIVVPFSPETELSGVGHVLQPDEVLHYRRTLVVPDSFTVPGGRVLLHLGAVDQWCRVLLDGTVVGEHDGGYLPVTCDLTDVLRPGEPQRLHVVVRDPTDTGPGLRGKQTLEPGGIWYTPQSGIWQTVWLEAVPDPWVDRLSIVCDLDDGSLAVTVHLGGTGAAASGAAGGRCEVVVSAAGAEVGRAAGPAGRPLVVDIPSPRSWSPEHPFLYDLLVTAGADTVRSYAGMRSFGVGSDADGVPRLLLNGRPYFHAGVLDQGYWSDGGYTAPSDEALVHDIATMKRLGFTMLRKHVKVEPLRWYHHCDRLGMLVWQDLVNGGGAYQPRVVAVPAGLPLHLRDDRYRLFARADAAAREQWLAEAEATVEHLRSVVSLAVWVPFNEGWGQFDAAAVAARVKALDPTRPVDHASGWHDQGAGDLTSLHVYVKPFRVPRRRRATAHRALALSEYGGYSWRVPGHSVSDREFGYRRFDDPTSLAKAFVRLHRRQVVPAIARGLAASVYTQVSDVEDEANGLLTYDRRVLKIPEEVVRSVTSQLRLS